ncbi:hypothetical protein M1466_02510 [Candidatus Dependentiae bacterium]|nr:hypothetical protein [Candidatus Dependentiae bacterium]
MKKILIIMLSVASVLSVAPVLSISTVDQVWNDIVNGLTDGSFPTGYKPGTKGFRTLQQFEQWDRVSLKGRLQDIASTMEQVPDIGGRVSNNAAAIKAILNEASFPFPQSFSTTNSLVLQAVNDIVNGLNDGSFPYWYKPSKTGFRNLQKFKQTERDFLLEGLRMLAPTNKNTAAIAAILLKASSPQLSDSALAQKLTETLKISSSDAEKAVQQIEEK